MPATEAPCTAPIVRSLAVGVLFALAAGFAGGAVTIARQYQRFLAEQTPSGPFATVDSFLHSAGMGTSEEFLRRIARAGLPIDADVAYVAHGSRQDFWQTYYVASYLLSPRRVWVIAWCETPAAGAAAAMSEGCDPFPAVSDVAAAVAARGVRHVLVAGNHEIPLGHTRAHHLSASLTLLDLQ